MYKDCYMLFPHRSLEIPKNKNHHVRSITFLLCRFWTRKEPPFFTFRPSPVAGGHRCLAQDASLWHRAWNSHSSHSSRNENCCSHTRRCARSVSGEFCRALSMRRVRRVEKEVNQLESGSRKCWRMWPSCPFCRGGIWLLSCCFFEKLHAPRNDFSYHLANPLYWIFLHLKR